MVNSRANLKHLGFGHALDSQLHLHTVFCITYSLHFCKLWNHNYNAFCITHACLQALESQLQCVLHHLQHACLQALESQLQCFLHHACMSASFGITVTMRFASKFSFSSSAQISAKGSKASPNHLDFRGSANLHQFSIFQVSEASPLIYWQYISRAPPSAGIACHTIFIATATFEPTKTSDKVWNDLLTNLGIRWYSGMQF